MSLRNRLVLVFFSLAALPALADELVLANGDTLTGEVIEWAIGHVVIDHLETPLLHQTGVPGHSREE